MMFNDDYQKLINRTWKVKYSHGLNGMYHHVCMLVAIGIPILLDI